jgi:XRE family transcriptional regulator, regulator of sulfur utilization
MAQVDRSLAATLRRLRAERGIAQEELAHMAGISTGSLSRIEREQASPAWTTVGRIAEALDMSVAELAEAVEHDAA